MSLRKRKSDENTKDLNIRKSRVRGNENIEKINQKRPQKSSVKHKLSKSRNQKVF